MTNAYFRVLPELSQRSFAEVFRAVVVVVVCLGVGGVWPADLVVVQFVPVVELWNLRLVVLLVVHCPMELLRGLCQVWLEVRVYLRLWLNPLIIAQVVSSAELPVMELL